MMGSRARILARWILTRWILATTATALAVVTGLVLCPSASAEVTISPPGASQGGATRVTFYVPDDRGTAYTTKVQVELPAKAPIGEVDPLSVPNWAPLLTYRELATPVPGIHSGATTTVAAAVTWTRVGKPAARREVSQLMLSMGPLPFVDRLPFNVVQTYSDGAVRRWSTGADGATTAGADGAGPMLILTPAPGANPGSTAGTGAMPGMEGMAGMNGSNSTGTTPAAPATLASGARQTSDSLGSLKALNLGLAGCVAIIALWGAWMIRRNRRLPQPPATAPDAPGGSAEAESSPTEPAEAESFDAESFDAESSPAESAEAGPDRVGSAKPVR
jgi:uncharacterized protein YcnI